MRAVDTVRDLMHMVHEELFDLEDDGSGTTTVTEASTRDTLLLRFTGSSRAWFELRVRALPSAPRACAPCVEAVGRDLGLTGLAARLAAYAMGGRLSEHTCAGPVDRRRRPCRCACHPVHFTTAQLVSTYPEILAHLVHASGGVLSVVSAASLLCAHSTDRGGRAQGVAVPPHERGDDEVTFAINRRRHHRQDPEFQQVRREAYKAASHIGKLIEPGNPREEGERSH